MDNLVCKRCTTSDYCKNGTVRGLPRFLCKACGYNFTNTPKRGKPASMKAQAIDLYIFGRMSFCGIAKHFGVSDTTILRWVRSAAQAVPEPEIPADAQNIMIDEMWHFVQKNTKTMDLARY
jgi:transposase-like protein